MRAATAAAKGREMDKSLTVYINPSAMAGSQITTITPARLSSHKHELTLESELWDGLAEICAREHSTLNAICTAVLMTMTPGQSLERGMRFFIFDYFRTAATNEGHTSAGHGAGLSPISPALH